MVSKQSFSPDLIKILAADNSLCVPDAGYMAPRPHMPRLDPLVLEELYERGLLEPVALPASAGLEGEKQSVTF